MSKGILHLVVFLLLVQRFYDCSIYAQSNSIAFDLIATDQLETYVIESLYEDSNGFIWIGTQGGLHRYDSAIMQKYTPRPGESALLSNEFVQAITEAPKGTGIIWVGTQGGGVNRFDPITETFDHYRHDSTDVFTLSHDDVTALHLDKSGTLWIGTLGGGLNLFDFDRNRIERAVEIVNNDDERSQILSIHENPGIPHWLWIGTTDGLFLFNTKARTFHEVLSTNKEAWGHSFGRVNSIISGPGGSNILWLGTAENGLIKLDIRFLAEDDQPIIEKATFYFPETHGLTSENINVVYPDKLNKNALWIGYGSSGLDYFVPDRGILTNHQVDAEKKNSLSHNTVLSIIQDKHGLLWVGTWGWLNKQHPQTGFKAYHPDASPNSKLPQESIFDIRTSYHSNQRVWLSFQQGGLVRWDDSSFPFTSYFNNENHQLYSLKLAIEDSDGNVWLGNKGDMLSRFDWQKDEIEHVSLKMNGIPGSLQAVIEYPVGSHILWYGTRDNGIFLFDSKQRKVIDQFRHSRSEESSLSANKVWDFLIDDTQNLWVATEGGGINRFDPVSRSFTHFSTMREKISSIGEDCILAIEEDNDGDFWLGTCNRGLLRFDIETDSIKIFNESSGVPHYTVGTLVKDKKGLIWLGTSNGIARLNPELETIHSFGVEDGIHGETVHYGAGAVTPEGLLFMGGREGGLTLFWPDSIHVDDVEPDITITGIYIGDQRYSLEEFIEQNPSRLKPTENDLRFEYSVMNYVVPSRNTYQLILEGADDQWEPVTSDAIKEYSNLAPGNYTFKVKGANAHGVWSKEGTSVDFRIMPYFWQSAWFWALISLVVIGLVSSAYQYRIYQIRRIESTRQRIANDLHDDMGSKISNLAIQLDMARLIPDSLEELRLHLSELAQAERQLVDDLRMIVWLVDVRFDSLIKLVERMELETDQMLRGRRYNFESPSELPDLILTMEIRKNIFLFFKEAIHNALRHSQADHFLVRVLHDDELLSITIEDDGIGYNPDSVIPGQGLRSMQNRVNQIGGHLTVNTSSGKGTQLILDVELSDKKPWYHVILPWIHSDSHTTLI